MRVAFCNNAPVRTARRLFAAGEYPAQKLWGAVEMEASGHDVHYVDVSGRWPLLERAGLAARDRLGEIATERAVLRLLASGQVDVVFAGAEQTLPAVSLMRAAGIVRKPVAAVYHNPPRRAAKNVARGYDHVFALTEKAYEGLLDAGRPADRTTILPWGPQLDFAAYRSTASEYVVSCGKSCRDIGMFATAVARADVPALVYAPDEWAAPEPSAALEIRRFSEVLPYPRVLADMARASVVAIPLDRTDRALGLSELADAMAMSKPVVITRSPFLDVDVEKIGCGIVVELGDADAWSAAISLLHNDPDLARRMGQAGRRFAERQWNSSICAQAIGETLEELVRAA